MIKVTDKDLLNELGFFESYVGDLIKKGHTGVKGIAKMLYISAILKFLSEKEGHRFDCLLTALLQNMNQEIQKNLYSGRHDYGCRTRCKSDF